MAKFIGPDDVDTIHQAALESQGGVNNKVINLFQRKPKVSAPEVDKKEVDNLFEDVIRKNKENLERIRRERAALNRRTIREQIKKD